MKDKQTLLWLYKNLKQQLLSMLALILSNAVFSGCGILFALACRSVIDSAHVQATYEKMDSLFFQDVSSGYDRELL